MIIDRESYTNVIGTTFMEKLNLPIIKYRRLYKL